MKTQSISKYIVLGAGIMILALVTLLTLIWQTPKQAEGATGGKFVMSSVWLFDQASSTLARSSTNLGFTSTAKGTTTPNEIFFAANSTTTVNLDTSGLSDYRLNFMVNATNSPVTITLGRSIIGSASTTDVYPDSDLATTGILGALTQNPLINVLLSTTTDMRTNVNSQPPSVSVHLKNTNSPSTRLTIGTNAIVGLSLEVVKVRPN